MKARFLKAAKLELEEAVDYYNGEEDGLGDDFAVKAAEALRRVRRFPNAWSILAPGIRRCRLNRFPYGLVYGVRDKEILIIAVMHQRRKPGYWKHRLKDV